MMIIWMAFTLAMGIILGISMSLLPDEDHIYIYGVPYYKI